MKCPHCNYVSFEYLNTCRKCSKDLSSHKSQFGIEYLEPVSLGILTFVERGPAAAVEAEQAASTFDTGDFGFASESDTGGHVVIEDQEPAAATFAESGTDEMALDFGGGDIAIPEISAAPEEEAASEIQVGSADLGEIASDSGFSLNLGDELGEGGGLSINLDDTGGQAGAGTEESGGEISLSLDALEDEVTQVSSAAQPANEQVVIGDEALTGIEFNFDTDSTLEIKPGTSAPAPEKKAGGEDEFADLDLSLDDKNLFGEGGGEKQGDEIDLGDIDLKLGDDDLGLKF
ncbi:MAG: hypothetical protein HZB29_07230 [Nitrospinae bacterium]|nr:hypothetical protein [Nitrospinota bacterium]